MSVTMSAIVVRNLSKTFRVAQQAEGLSDRLRSLVRPHYRSVSAVRDVSFAVEAGESLAFLGPNGAGKSTTIKILTGLLTPSSGVAQVLGFDPQKDRKRLELRHRDGVRTEEPAVVPPARHRQPAPPRRRLRGRAARAPAADR